MRVASATVEVRLADGGSAAVPGRVTPHFALCANRIPESARRGERDAPWPDRFG